MTRYLIILICLMLQTGCQQSEPSPTATPSSTPHLFAHRGLSEYAPENTLPAFATAISLGLAIEADVHLTADNHLVLIHDDTLERSTNGIGKVVERTLAELKTLDAGSHFDPAYGGVQIPTLKELLELVKNTQWRPTMIALHMKGKSSGIEDRVVRLVEEYQMLDQVIAFGLNSESAEHFQSANPKFPIFVPGWTWDRDGNRIATVDEIASAHAQGKGVWLFGSCISRKPSCWENAKRVQVDGFLTHYPLEVREYWRGAYVEVNKAKENPTPRKPMPTYFPSEQEAYKKGSFPLIVTKGGLKEYAPENTLPALSAAVDLGFGVALNIHQTKDGALVVINDETVDRTTNGKGLVAEQNLIALLKLDAGAWFDSAYTSLKIPTLDEALNAIRTHQWKSVQVVINLTEVSENVADQIIASVEKYQMKEEVTVFVMDKANVKGFKEFNGGLNIVIDDYSNEGEDMPYKNGTFSIVDNPLVARNQWRNLLYGLESN